MIAHRGRLTLLVLLVGTLPAPAQQFTFRDVTKASEIGDDCCTTVASWADYDNDGLLDLYVVRYLDPGRDTVVVT